MSKEMFAGWLMGAAVSGCVYYHASRKVSIEFLVATTLSWVGLIFTLTALAFDLFKED